MSVWRSLGDRAHAGDRHRFASPRRGRLAWRAGAGLLAGLAIAAVAPGAAAQWQTRDPRLNAYCQFLPEAAAEIDRLRQAALTGGPAEQQTYRDRLYDRARALLTCRQQTWPQTQAVWLRLYPCDARPGRLEALFDRIANLGYNQVYLETFYDGQVLLPQADNPTPWPSVVRAPGYESADLLAEAILKGRERGVQVYAWAFTLNFGYPYFQQPGRAGAIARNGRGQTSPEVVYNGGEVFVDPYHPQARADYRQMLAAVMRRRPAGVLFDYVRYPRGTGGDSVADDVKDLWIYGEAARSALLDRAGSPEQRAAIARYLDTGASGSEEFPASGLWPFALNHARQGVLSFLNAAIAPLQAQGVPVGFVFFPGGNQTVGTGGFDSRLQPWPQFPASGQWHPMAYAVCGRNDCILEEVRRVLAADAGAEVVPALAGVWGSAFQNRPALEAQMRGLQQSVPQIRAVSHFSYEWQHLDEARDRKFCRLR